MKNPFVKINKDVSIASAMKYLYEEYGTNINIGPNAINAKLSRKMIDGLVDVGSLTLDKKGWYCFVNIWR
jgi:hypothetical protein